MMSSSELVSDKPDSRLEVILSDGAVRNGYIKIPSEQTLFPGSCIAVDESTPSEDQFTLDLPNGKSIQSVILANRKRIQARFNGLFARSGLKDGDKALITKTGDKIYQLSFQPAASSGSMATAKAQTEPMTVQPQKKQKKTAAVALNQILFGPPGTGKTYATVRKALEILEPHWLEDLHRQGLPAKELREQMKQRFDALHAQGRVQFTTFHQSFSYEDFVEGIRAISDEETKQLSYQVVDGVFKSLCEVAAATTVAPVVAAIDLGQRQVWKMSLGNTQGADAGIYDECLQGGYVLLGYGGDIDFSGSKSRQDVLAKYKQAGVDVASGDYAVTSVAAFVVKMKVGDLIVVSDGNYKFRAIGEVTSDYEYAGVHEVHDDGYAQRRQVRWLRQYSPSLPCSELLERAFSQVTLYALNAPNLVREKLQHLLGAVSAADSAFPFYVGQTIGTGYKVLRISDDLIELSKPRDADKVLHLPRNPIETLIGYVRSGQLTVDDIRQKRVFDIVPDAPLEKFLINGYENVLAAMAQLAVQPGSAPASTHTNDARVLVIDEINRGNVSRIFGELITLLESSKRAGAPEALSVTLPYSKTKFSVPSNVYIIGTMNTTDRSLAGLDVALRRRFDFEELMPDPSTLHTVVVQEGNVSVDVEQLLTVMNERIEALLDREHQLGHAYFMPLREASTREVLAQIFRNRVLPLLQEYFFDDWERIAWVLNDHRKPEANAFVQRHGKSLDELFGTNDGVQAVDKRWCINPLAFESLESYAQVIKVRAAATDAEAAQVLQEAVALVGSDN
ncbi:MAG: AAA family ATPase [Comamonas sp.]|uniref:AAA family ATPase n=2 Tax=Comamonas sp. TaxID=34028 RepID=UPI002FC73BEE